MAIYHYGIPTAIESLVFCLDAKNGRSLKHRSFPHEHGIADWVAMVNGTVSYAAPYPGTTIYEIDSLGNETVKVSKTSLPSSGTFGVVAGRRYYGTRPIHLLQTGFNHVVVPLSLTGTIFGGYSSRYNSSNYYLYSPFGDATVEVFDNVAGGTTGTPTTTLTVSENTVLMHSTTTENAWVFFESDYPIVMTVTEEDEGDKMILPPASKNLYRRTNEHEITNANSSPDTIETFYVSDSSYVCMSIEIADGLGACSEAGLGLESLSTEFALGMICVNYEIVAPHKNTKVVAEFWDSSSESWIEYQTHNIQGDPVDPPLIRVGPYSGSGTDLSESGATLWRWRSNYPIFMHVNDISSDEEILLGWDRNNTRRGASERDLKVYNALDQSEQGEFEDYNTSDINPQLTKQNGYFSFKSTGQDGVVKMDSSLLSLLGVTSGIDNNVEYSMEVFFYAHSLPSISGRLNGMALAGNATNWGIGFQILASGGQAYLNFSNRTNGDYTGTTALATDTWYHAIATRGLGTTSAPIKIYLNGEIDLETTGDARINYTSSSFQLGKCPDWVGNFDGRISFTKLYNKALSESEVKALYNSCKNRFL